jgi:hypothetical protein
VQSTPPQPFRTGEHDWNPAVRLACVQDNDWPTLIAVALFVGVKQNIIAFGSEELRIVLAVAAVALPLVNIVTRKDTYDWVCSSLSRAGVAWHI